MSFMLTPGFSQAAPTVEDRSLMLRALRYPRGRNWRRTRIPTLGCSQPDPA